MNSRARKLCCCVAGILSGCGARTGIESLQQFGFETAPAAPPLGAGTSDSAKSGTGNNQSPANAEMFAPREPMAEPGIHPGSAEMMPAVSPEPDAPVPPPPEEPEEPEAEEPPGPCDPTVAFGPPQQVLVPTMEANYHIDKIWFSQNELELYLSAASIDQPSQYDIFVADRESLAERFGAPRLLDGVNAASDRRPVLTNDGLSLYFESNRDGDSDIYVATRPTDEDTFSEPVVVPAVSSSRIDKPGAISPADDRFYFSSTRLGGQENIYFANRDPEGNFEPLLLIASIDEDGDNTQPVVTQEERVVYFGSERQVQNIQGGLDIFVAERRNRDSTFDTPLPVVELNSVANEAPSWISQDGCTLFFTSDRNGATALYLAARGQ